MPITYAGELDTQVYNDNVTTTGAGTANGDSFDVQNLEGTALLTIDDRASGTAAATIAVEDSEDDSTFAAIDSDALFDPDDGQADTFTALSTAASNQSLGINLQKAKRYIRVTFTGTDIDHEVAVVLVGGKKYTGGIG